MKVGYELELLTPVGLTRKSIAEAFAKKYALKLKSNFHRESELWPGSQNKTSYYCLTKCFELWNSNHWSFRFVNDMTIQESLIVNTPESEDWYHILSDDIRLIDLILQNCNSDSKTSEILKPIADFYKTEVKSHDNIYSVTGKKSKLICGAHSRMTDRNRICEIITAPIADDYQAQLAEIVELAKTTGCAVPVEGAFHIHFDGLAFANSKTLLKMIRYFYIWSDVLKSIIPPNPNCKRLGEYSQEIVDYAFDLANENKSF